MITKYSTAAARYDELFTMATERLKMLQVKNENGLVYNGVDVKINTLEEYFSNLRNLIYGSSDGIQPTQEQIKEGYIFLKLPLDEPYFTINANSREITVPETFKKNGISVLGDEVSEMLFFSVDRFYDATDLSQLDIAFYWSHSADADHTVYSTPAFFSVLESDDITGDDKLIFGWPISSEMTKQAGKVTFSVRFFAKDSSVTPASDDYSLVYSLSTLPQTVFINAGLTYDIKGIDVDNRLDLILQKRLVNSPLGKKDPPAVPVIVFARSFSGIEPTITYLDELNITEQITKDLTLAVLGYKDKSGDLTYAWYYDDGENAPALISDFSAPLLNGQYVKTEHFIALSDTQVIATYYYKDSYNNYVQVHIESEEEFDAYTKDLYVCCSVYTLTSENVRAGRYYARPKNTLFNATATNEDTPRYIWVVNGADTPQITSTSWGAQKIVEYTGGLQLSVTGENLTNANHQWMADFSTTSIVNDTSSLVFAPYSAVTKLPIAEEGYYKVVVTNTRNNDSKSAESATVLVLKNITEAKCTATLNGRTLTINLDRSLAPFETIECAWYTNSDRNTPVATTNTMSYTFETDNAYYVTVTIKKGTFEKVIANQISAS